MSENITIATSVAGFASLFSAPVANSSWLLLIGSVLFLTAAAFGKIEVEKEKR